MGIANRIINILVLLAAIAAIVLGVMLFNKREDIAKSRELMAENIAANAKKLYPPTKIKPQDMSIDKRSTQIKDPLAKLDMAAKKLLNQRSQMAEDILKLASIPAEGVGMDNFRMASLASHDKYSEAMKSVMDHVSAKVKTFTDTRAVLYKSIPQLNSKMRMAPLEEGKFTNDDEGVAFAKSKVGELESKADDICTRNETYDQHIKQISNLIPNMDMPVLDGADYAENLKTQRDGIEKYVAAYEGIVRERNALKEETAQQKQKIEDLGKKLESTEQQVAKAEKDLKAAKKVIARLEKIIRPSTETNGAEMENTSGVAASYSLLKQLQGKIVCVDVEHGFVVVNLGKVNQVEIKNSKGAKEKKSVQLPQNAILTVSASLDPAQAHFTGKIQIVKSCEKKSIANILPTPDKKIPRVGDVVYFSNFDLESIRVENEKKLKEMQEKAAKEAAAIRASASQTGDVGSLLSTPENEEAAGESADSESGEDAAGDSEEKDSGESSDTPAEDEVI